MRLIDPFHSRRFASYTSLLAPLGGNVGHGEHHVESLHLTRKGEEILRGGRALSSESGDSRLSLLRLQAPINTRQSVRTP